MDRKILLGVIALLFTLNLIVGAQVYQKFTGPEKSEDYSNWELLSKAMQLVKSNYVEPVTTKELVYGALKGMLSELDPHSQFMDPDTYKEMKIDTTGEFGGLGIEITKRGGFVTIITPIYGTPAYRKGLLPGDKIVKINGELLRNPNLNDVVKKLRGEPGTDVTVMILRGVDKIITVTITRDVIKVPSITEARIIEDNIGYIQIAQFHQLTAEDLDNRLKELESQGMDSLILDLRDNPGGLLQSAVDVADLFIPGGHTIVSTKGRVPFQSWKYSSHNEGTHPGYPLVVLINKGSASASEIVAGAIKDLHRGYLVGEKSYGKGSVQTILTLPEDTALRLTTAKYYTPDGKSIEEEGIEPDWVVEVSEEDELKRRMQRFKPMEESLEKLEESKEEKIKVKTIEEDEELRKLLEESGGKKEEEEEFIDIQLQRAIDIIKIVKFVDKRKSVELGLGITAK